MTDPLFTAHQELILVSLGVTRDVRPNIDLPAICRFDAPDSLHYISDTAPDSRLYGVNLFDEQRSHVRY